MTLWTFEALRNWLHFLGHNRSLRTCSTKSRSSDGLVAFDWQMLSSWLNATFKKFKENLTVLGQKSFHKKNATLFQRSWRTSHEQKSRVLGFTIRSPGRNFSSCTISWVETKTSLYSPVNFGNQSYQWVEAFNFVDQAPFKAVAVCWATLYHTNFSLNWTLIFIPLWYQRQNC